jgi:hypothetical protein
MCAGMANNASTIRPTTGEVNAQGEVKEMELGFMASS